MNKDILYIGLSMAIVGLITIQLGAMQHEQVHHLINKNYDGESTIHFFPPKTSVTVTLPENELREFHNMHIKNEMVWYNLSVFLTVIVCLLTGIFHIMILKFIRGEC